jgi:CheY-like chemotaxis protein/ligand-binding sensor protein
MDRIWNILLVEDDEDDYILTSGMLSGARTARCKLVWARSYHEGQNQLINAPIYDAVLMDYDLGSGTGIELIRNAVRHGYPAPFILLTGRGSYEVDLEAMEAGASLYLTKEEVNAMLLERSIRYAIERKQIESELAASNERLQKELGERRKAETALKRIEWLLTKNLDASLPTERIEANPPQKDLTALNTSRLILDTVGKGVLEEIVSDFLAILDTSAAVYERNGDYALGSFSSGWCRYLDTASRLLCATDDDRQAMDSGRWLCHESCWQKASQPSILTGQPYDIACEGGIHIFAAPILANGEVIGSINFGYGDPPRDPERLQEIAEKYQVPVEDLVREAKAYESRPPYMIALARKRLLSSANLLGALVERKQAEQAQKTAIEKLMNSEGREKIRAKELQMVMDAAPAYIWISHDPECLFMLGNKATYELVRMPAGGNVSKSAPKSEMPRTFRPYKDGIELAANQLPMQITASTGQALNNFEFEMRFEDGQSAHLVGNTSPLFDTDGAPAGAIGVFIDITGRKQAERALTEHNEHLYRYTEQLKQSTQSMDDCDSNVSSEMKERVLELIENLLEVRGGQASPPASPE